MPQVPVVTMTAYSDVQIAVEALKTGAIDFVEKPWRNEKMVATIMAAFERSQSEKKIAPVGRKSPYAESSHRKRLHRHHWIFSSNEGRI
ncbi:MAG: response regulator [Saprospiraceae bacterium]|nr:response regulator [Saprospiraceae bacterium]